MIEMREFMEPLKLMKYKRVKVYSY